MLNKVPTYVLRALQILEQNNFEAYIVGGAVRDLYLNLTPLDFDLVTNALPQETTAVFSAAGIKSWDNNGSQFGIVNILMDEQVIEIATFRQEIYGEDPHRPEEVSFCDSLQVDLSRRDFTVNALALGLDNILIDCHQGVEDLQEKIIRTIGDPEQRFSEDALRMFRACRLANQLDFSVAENIISAIKKLLTKANELSVDRVKHELEKIIMSEKVVLGINLLYETGLHEVLAQYKSNGKIYHTKVWGNINHSDEILNKKIIADRLEKKLSTLPQDLSIRWATVLQPFEHQEFLKFFARDKMQEILFLSQNYQLPAKDLAGLKKWLLEKIKQKTFSRKLPMMSLLKKISLIYSLDALDKNVVLEFLQWAGDLPLHSSELAIKTTELEWVQAQGVTYKEIFSCLLDAVQNGRIANQRAELLSLLQTSFVRKS